jgi:hypothetical protein
MEFVKEAVGVALAATLIGIGQDRTQRATTRVAPTNDKAILLPNRTYGTTSPRVPTPACTRNPPKAKRRVVRPDFQGVGFSFVAADSDQSSYVRPARDLTYSFPS